MKLYHREIFWKDEFENAVQEWIATDFVKVSSHIKNDNKNRTHCKHNEIDINALISTTYKVRNRVRPYYLFDIETDDINGSEQITKAVFRTSFNKNYDIVIVVRKNKIVTAWLQIKADTHCTLDKTKYFSK